LFLVFSDHLVHQMRRLHKSTTCVLSICLVLYDNKICLKYQMNKRLVKNEGRFDAECLNPSKLQRLCLEGDQVGRLYATYSTDIHVAEDVFVREIQCWRTRWGMMDEKPSTPATLSLSNKNLYPSIYAIISILVTMSSSSATAER